MAGETSWGKTGVVVAACMLAIVLIANLTVIAFRWGTESQQLSNIQTSLDKIASHQELQDTKIEQGRIDFAALKAAIQMVGGSNNNGDNDRRRRN